MIYEFATVPLYPAAASVHIKFRKAAAVRPAGVPSKSLDTFKVAQSAFLKECKTKRH
jgi:hypothetical protein